MTQIFAAGVHHSVTDLTNHKTTRTFPLNHFTMSNRSLSIIQGPNFTTIPIIFQVIIIVDYTSFTERVYFVRSSIKRPRVHRRMSESSLFVHGANTWKPLSMQSTGSLSNKKRLLKSCTTRFKKRDVL